MKDKIHPKYFQEAETKCACGHIFKIGSVKEKLGVEICSKCHPFYTGGSKLVDTAGKIEKFKRRFAKKQS